MISGEAACAMNAPTALPALPFEPDTPATIGRRAAARLRLAISARFVSIHTTQACILLDLSRLGARIGLTSPIAEGQSGYLEVARFAVFGTVVRTDHGNGGGINAIAFDDPMSGPQVLEIRRFAEDFESRERDALRDQVRRWVSGEP
jgi:hypothetical protein